MQEGSKNEISSNFPKLEAAKLCLPSAILLFGRQCTKSEKNIYVVLYRKYLGSFSLWIVTWMKMKNHESEKPQKARKFSHINQCIDVSINMWGCGNLQESEDLKTSEKFQCINLLRHLALPGGHLPLTSVTREQCINQEAYLNTEYTLKYFPG